MAANERGEFFESENANKTLRHPLTLKIWAKQKHEISSRRILAKLENDRIYSRGVSGERSYPQDCNGEEIYLILVTVKELSWKYQKWPKMESTLGFFRFSTFYKFSKLGLQIKRVNFSNAKMSIKPWAAP